MNHNTNQPLILEAALDQMHTLRARLAEVEAERDAALERAREAREMARNFAEHCGNACKQLEAVEAERDALIAGQSQLYAKIEEAAKDAQRLEAERDAARAEVERLKLEAQPYEDRIWSLLARATQAEAALESAQAGEARAVEFASTVKSTIEESLEWAKQDPEVAIELLKDLMNQADGIGYAHELGNALAWLAQQRGEAAAKALLGLKDSIRGGTYRPHVAWRCISTRAASLRAGATGGADA